MSDKANPPPAPRLRLILNSTASIDGKEYLLQQRLHDKWLFISMDNELLPLTDSEVVKRQQDGCFVVISRPGIPATTVKPPSPLNVSEAANKRNLRKLDYVSACKADPSYCRSRSVLKPIINSVATDRRRKNPTEKTPSFTAVLSWITRFEEHGPLLGAAALSERHDMKGNFGGRLAEYQSHAIDAGITTWLSPRVSVVNAYATVCATIDAMDKDGTVDKFLLPPGFLDQDGKLKPPSLRTFTRRCNAVDPAVRDSLKIGTEYVKKNYRTFNTMPVPDVPYQDVEVDHCTLDLLIKHKSGVILGRPDIVVFRDRATAMILGWGLSLDQPSYASFLTGLKTAMYGPNLSHVSEIKNRPFWFGRIQNLYHDNALHEVGDSIKAAAKQLGTNLVRLQPREPWLKGALERFFRELGVGLIHRLPGTTLEHAVARKEYEVLGQATIAFDQCDAVIARWVCDVHNAAPSKALGFIRGFDGGVSPIAAWSAKKEHLLTDELPDPELFIALAGQIEKRSIQRNGVTIDYITYESPLLARIIGNPKHKRRARDGKTSLYDIARDPHDLGYVFLIDPYSGDRLKIPACAAHAEYANGLTLVEHNIIVARAREERGKKVAQFKDLQSTRAALNELAAGIMASGTYRTAQRKLGRWLEGDRLREQKSRIQSYAHNGADYLLADPIPDAGRVIGSSTTQSVTPMSTRKQPELKLVSPTLAGAHSTSDLDELRKVKKWN